MLAALDGLGKIFDSIRANVYKEAMTAPTITVFVCLGSNTPDAAHMLSLAVERLRALPRARVDALSGIYLTEPQDYADQPWFHNQVVRMELETDWTPQSFVRALLAEEKQLGRQRSSDPALRFGPRCIDMDLLLFGDSQCDAPESIVPHPRMMWVPPAASTAVPRRNGWPGSSIDRKVREFFSDAQKLLCYPRLR